MSTFKKLTGCVDCAPLTDFTDCAGNRLRANATLATCDDIPLPTEVAVTNTVAGNRIATIDVDGVPTDINQTVVELEDVDFDAGTRTLTVKVKGENGLTQTKTTDIPAIDAVTHIAPDVIDVNDLYPQFFNTIVSDADGLFYAFDVNGVPTPLNFIETVTKISNTLPAGRKIFDYENESALVKDVFVPIPVLGTPTYSGTTLTIPFDDGSGTFVDKTVTLPAAVSGTPFLLNGSTTTDATTNKTAAIWRSGPVAIGPGTGSFAPQHQLDIVSNFSVRNAAGLAGSGYGFEFNTNANAPRMDIVFNGAYVGQFKASANDFIYGNSRTNIGRHVFFTKTSAGDINRVIFENDGRVWVGVAPTVVTATKTLVRVASGHISEQNVGQLVSLTTAQINALTGQSNGQMYYNSTINKVVVRENSAWMRVTTSPM